MKILVLKDDKPGHYNQTDGLVMYLKDIYKNLEIEYIEVKIKSKISRKILRFLLNNFNSFFEKESNLKYLSFFYEKYQMPKQKPDIVISTGGNVSNINAWFSKVYNCKNILNGALRGLNENLFTYITTVIDLGYKNQIILDVAPNLISDEKLIKKSKDFIKDKNLNENTTYYSLLIGGNGSGYKFDEDFYKSLIEFVKMISKEKNVKWLVTTSRRTPQNIESFLEKNLNNEAAYFVAYNKNEEKILLPFLGLSKYIFVTEESSSMISEAISAKKPVFTLGIRNSNLDKNYKKILKKFSDENKIKRLLIDNKNKLIIKNIFDYDFNLLKEINKNFKEALTK